MQNIKNDVALILEQDPNLLPAAVAERLGVVEFAVVSALPKEMVALVPGEDAQAILEGLVDFGPVTTIVQSFGSIFEVKAPFPKGKVARGYYNLMGSEGQMHGHLKLDNVKNIALVSKPFMGRESHYFGFFCGQGNNIFKVYLGRDEKRQLIRSQVEQFKNMQAEFNQ
ncbi:heme utilization cystosolic carrier protein HutX [Vibrio intestinalis]|uniref:heme utilization cystosolic carrier protein HutX n=1 Tax=Vibrio intestinalis TaxID=2933291 RepID=UPI0021A6E644|nr:heme utilization cystosolic carrier protein HutX [Vibrio intestinalis]